MKLSPTVNPTKILNSLQLLSNRRRRSLAIAILSATVLIMLLLSTQIIGQAGWEIALAKRNLPPCFSHPFGTDWLGRDMLGRSLHGLSLSLWVGLLTATISAVVGLMVGTLSATLGGKVDAVMVWVIDVFFSLPHLVLIILVAFAMGGGTQGLIISIALTHWHNLARLLRAEVLQVKNSDYVQLSAKLGHSPLWIAYHHILPHLVPQFLVGLILLFPHVILHEAGLTFLGLGLSAETPAVGIILSESMRYLSTGNWWLGILPGVALLIMVQMFDILGQSLRALLDPRTSQS